jgi:predicted PurR-regulated permease PerM
MSALGKDNPTLELDGKSAKRVVVLFDTTKKEVALALATFIPGFTPDEDRIGPVDGQAGMSVVGEATLPIAEEGRIVCIYPFGGDTGGATSGNAKRGSKFERFFSLNLFQSICLSLGLAVWTIIGLAILCERWNIPALETIIVLTATLAISAGLMHPVAFLQHKIGLNRAAAIGLIFLVFFGLLGVAGDQVVYLLSHNVPAVATKVSTIQLSAANIHAYIPDLVERYLPTDFDTRVATFVQSQTNNLAGWATIITTKLKQFAETLMTFASDSIFIMAFSFLLTLSEEKLPQYLTFWMEPGEEKDNAMAAIKGTNEDLGHYVNAQVAIGAFYGLSFGSFMQVFFGYGFAIGLVGFLLESIVPMAGSSVTLFLMAIPVAGLQWGLSGIILVLIVWFIIFLVQWHPVYLIVMGRALNLDPFLTLVCMWVGAGPFTTMGTVIVLPWMVILWNVFLFIWPHLKSEETEKVHPDHLVWLHNLNTRVVLFGHNRIVVPLRRLGRTK